MLQFKRRQSEKHEFAEREASASSFIPYMCHWDKSTLITKKDELVQIIKIEGYAFETADDEDVDMRKLARNSLLKGMADGKYALWFHTVRRHHSVFPDGKFQRGFANYVNECWRHKHETKSSYINELYISVVYKADTAGAAKFEHMLNQLIEAADKNTREASMREAHKDLSEATYRILATLKEYSPRLLGVIETENGAFSEPLEFLGRLVNCGETQPTLVPTMDISRYLASSRLYFGKRAIEARSATGRRFATVLSVQEYAPATAAGMLDAFLQLPFEFIISQSYSFINRQVAIEKMQLQQRRMMSAEDVAVSQVAEISDALDMAMGGHVAFGEHHMTVICFANDLKSLEDVTSMAAAEITNLGMKSSRETMFMEIAYWAQLPANFDFIGRKATINSMNLAAFASLHNYPVGRIRRNHWGNCVTVFDTTSGTPYFFNFHNRDVGHTTIIGPTGAGKTVLMNFLCAQAQKFNCRMFFFDKDRGAEVFIRALGGVYTIIHPGDACGFNPLQLPETHENKTFLGEWMKAMLTVHGEQFTTEDMAAVAEAVRGNFKLDHANRQLRNVAPFLGLEGPGKVASRLKMWHSGGQYSGLFDNPVDSLDFSKNRVFGFEMGEVLSDKVSLGATLLYLFHRISLSLDGTPTMIVLDEAWALIDNDIFAPKIKDWLKTLRKLNAMVVFATQSVEDASKSVISDTLVQQTATQIFLPNPKATDEYRKVFMLSEREFNLLKNTDPSTRFFLLKQGSDVVIARIDLSGMEDVIHILSGRAETVRVLDKVRAEVGDNPEVWIPKFLEGVENLAKSNN